MDHAQRIIELISAWRKHPARPGRLFIGIGGGSAAGKSTIARKLAERLAPLRVKVIGQDRFFKRGDDLPRYPSRLRPEPWEDHNHPDSFDLPAMLDACGSVDGTDIVIFEGILVLHYPEMRERMDVKCYVAADADERIVRRTKRQMAHSTFEDITDFYLESVRHQHERYNAPTQRHADLIIPGGMEDEAEREAIIECLCGAVRDAFGRGG